MNVRGILPALFLVVCLGQGCGSCGQKLAGMIEGPLNDPSNVGLRRQILAWGLRELCVEMTSRGVPLALTADAPAVGRFFPETCVQRELDNGDLFVEFAGRGYAWSNISKKLSFEASAAVHYDQDFRMDGSTAYVYFPTRSLQNETFRITVVEQPVASALNSLSSLGDTIGRQLLGGRLREGFTVVRDANGSAEFSTGMLPRGTRPSHPYETQGEGRVTYENTRSEVHQNQRDFIGPIRVDARGRALYLNVTLDGAPAADVLVMRAAEARASLESYLRAPQAEPLAGVPVLGDAVQANVAYQRALPVERGSYFVVLDNTSTAGPTAPTAHLFDDRAALFNYVVQVGDEP